MCVLFLPFALARAEHAALLKEYSVRIAGNYTFEATRDEVWSAINDPEVLARAIPGCQHLDQVGENEFETILKVGLQAVRGIYHGRVKIDNLVAPESYEIHVDGKGSNGFLKGNGAIKLRVEGDTTILDYGGEAQIGGTIASVGQRLIDGASKTLINQSLKALAALIEARRSGSIAPPEPKIPVSPALAEVAPASAEVAASVAAPASVAAVVAPEPPPAESFERRKIVVPAHEQLSEADVARGVVEDFLKERPWAPWVALAFLIGYMLGRRK
jgi:carbon monoxide dehydrogenase subunit G